MSKKSILSLSTRKLLVAPSILSADFAALGQDIERVTEAGADLIHVDIMDAHFVPNLTIGPVVVKSIRKYTNLIFDVHLMLSNPLKYVKPFADAGADHITFHLESDNDPAELIKTIRSCGCSAGISVKPGTAGEKLFPFLDQIDLVLVMSVEPGFGGQSFMTDMMPKVSAIRNEIKKKALDIHLEIDGGIDAKTVETAAKAGANMMVAGTSVFKSSTGYADAIKNLHTAQEALNTAL